MPLWMNETSSPIVSLCHIQYGGDDDLRLSAQWAIYIFMSVGIMAALFQHPDHLAQLPRNRRVFQLPLSEPFLFWCACCLHSYLFKCRCWLRACLLLACSHKYMTASWPIHGITMKNLEKCLEDQTIPTNYDAVEGRTQSWLTSGGFGTSNPLAQWV